MGHSKSTAVALVLLLVWAILFHTPTRPGYVRGPVPDSFDYAYGAEALLHWSYTVQYPAQIGFVNGRQRSYGGVPRVPPYPPGMAILLSPFVAVGGVPAAVWFSYLAGLTLGALMLVFASRLGSPGAAPLAVAFGLYNFSVPALSRIVMSDLPTTAITMALALFLAAGRGSRAAAGAGVLAGLLGLVRLSSLPLWFAGLAGLATRRPPMRHLILYAMASVPFFLAHAAWNWVAHGSPLAAGYGPRNPGMFDLQYLLGPPGAKDSANIGGRLVDSGFFGLPNGAAYVLSLAGVDLFLGWPLVGAVKLVALLHYVRRRDDRGTFARFALAVLVILYLIYVGYWYQGARFLMPAAALLNLSAAIAISDLLSRRQLILNLKARLPSRNSPLGVEGSGRTAGSSTTARRSG